MAIAEAGCPSGLAPPPEAAAQTDPTSFVRIGKDGAAHLELLVKGAKCAGCIRKIETGLSNLPGVQAARLNLSTQRLSIAFTPGALSPRDIPAKLTALGYESTPFDPEAGRRALDKEGRGLLFRMAAAGFAASNIMMFSVPIWAGTGDLGDGVRIGFYWISALIAIPCAIYAGQPFFKSAWAALSKGRANMDVPISIGVILTLAVSILETALHGKHAYFDGVVMLLFLLLVGRYLDHLLREKARTAAKELLALQAIATTRLNPDGVAESIAARKVCVGDLLLLAPGDRVPVNALIEEGASEVDRALLTGESAPAPMQAGQIIHAGIVNITHPLRVRAIATADASLVADLARMIEAGEQRRAGIMRLADKAAELYVPIVHTLAAATFVGWLAFGHDWRLALMNAAAVLIITCPCALGLAAPAVQVVATGRLFKRGILVKSGDALERLAQIDKVVLDKTGTLTLARPRLVRAPDDETLMRAASLARLSRHPLARALVEAAGPGKPAQAGREAPGEGVEAEIDGQPARLGKFSFVARGQPRPEAETVLESEIWFRQGEGAPSRFAFVDALRPDAAETIKRFKAMGLEPELLSGDRDAAVQDAARRAGIDVALGEQTPADKIARLDALRAAGKKVLMLGDGLNDAPALSAAHASASPGGAVEAAQAASDIVFQGQNLGAVLEALDVARAARGRMLENFALAALYNLIAAPMAVFGFVTPLIAALAMSSSSLIVTLNALRLSRRAPRGGSA